MLCIFFSVSFKSLYSHGFAAHTLVELACKKQQVPIQNISQKFFLGQKTVVATYKEKSKKWKFKNVQAVAFCKSCAFFELNFSSKGQVADIIRCSPLQLFYRVDDERWMPAYQLRAGDILLCKNNKFTKLQAKTYIAEPIQLFIIEIQKHHTFAVGSAKILTHNMFIPIAATMGMAIPFDIVCSAGSFGCMFGPVTFCCSIAVAGIAAAIAYQSCKEKHIDFALTSTKPGCFEMQPSKDGLFSHGNVIQNPCNDAESAYNPVGCFTLQPVQNRLFLYNDNQSKNNIKTVEDLLKGLPKGAKTKGKADQYIKKGDYDDAVKDFYSLNPSNVRKLPNKEGLLGILADGREVNVRIESSVKLVDSVEKVPTLEIMKKGGEGKRIKIRYVN